MDNAGKCEIYSNVLKIELLIQLYKSNSNQEAFQQEQKLKFNGEQKHFPTRKKKLEQKTDKK